MSGPRQCQADTENGKSVHNNDATRRKRQRRSYNDQTMETSPPDNIGKPAVALEDLGIVTQWVRNDLFERVKFLYSPDLQVNGRLYNLFVSDCKGRLVGLKNPIATGEYRKMYVELLWQEANKKKRNIVANGLTVRQSSVYSSMQNKFVGELQSSGCIERILACR